MSKYIPRYHWPNGYKLEQFKGSWLFAPFLGGYGNKQIVDYFCRGKTPEEAEQSAYNQAKVKPGLLAKKI
jgi:hypothetical protein